MSTALYALFAFLFKYRPSVFEQGDFAFGAPVPALALIVVVVALGVPALASYRRARGKSGSRDRWVLGGIRAAILLVVVACLFRPVLLLSAAVPQRNFVGVLIDDSQSMQIADRDGAPRSDFVRRQIADPNGALIRALRGRFQVRLFKFGSATQRLDSASELAYDERETHIGDAVESARHELESVPLSGLVVLTDGADNSRTPLAAELERLRARSVPVFTVGLGAAHFTHDVEIDRVDAPHTVLQNGTLVANVLVRQSGYAGKTVPLEVEDAGRIVARAEVTLPADGDVAPVYVHALMDTPGARVLTFRIPLQPGEQVRQNNSRTSLVNVQGGREKILYVEGAPRYEVRFIRAAVAADSNLQLVVLQRTAPNKFLRLNVDGPAELAGGFPTTRAELYRYKAIVLGSIEASFFSRDQLQMLADFVNVRGGGLLLLGGRQAFAEGGYAGTPLADVMPVVVSGPAVADSMTFFADLQPRLTPAGRADPITEIERSDSASLARWSTLPIVTSVNLIRGVKPGAATLVEGVVPPGGRAGTPGSAVAGYTQPLLVYQRYGRGVVYALPIQDSWQWQMDPSVPVGDPAFATFWRQLLRQLTAGVPGRVAVAAAADQVNPGEPVTLTATVADSSYENVNDARVVAHVTGPDGATRDVPLDWTVNEDGQYRGAFTPADTGLLRVHVEADRGTGVLAADSTVVRVADLNAEFVDAEMRADLLRRVAGETGGRFYTPATVGSLPEDLAMSRHGVTVVNQLDLWDMPAVFLLLLALMAVEWAYRRGRGLA